MSDIDYARILRKAEELARTEHERHLTALERDALRAEVATQAVEIERLRENANVWHARYLGAERELSNVIEPDPFASKDHYEATMSMPKGDRRIEEK